MRLNNFRICWRVKNVNCELVRILEIGRVNGFALLSLQITNILVYFI